MSHRPRLTFKLTVALTLLACAAAMGATLLVVHATGGAGSVKLAKGQCPPGSIHEREAGKSKEEVAREREGGTKSKSEAEREREAEQARETAKRGPKSETAALFSGPTPVEARCHTIGGPEPFLDLAEVNSARLSKMTAPATAVKRGAMAHARSQRDALVASGRSASVPGADGEWKELGTSTLRLDNQDYDKSDGSTRQGLAKIAGRVTAITRDPASGRLWAAASQGGVWQSDDNGDHWHSIGDGLPTQAVAGVAWTTAGGGTLLVLTGDDVFGQTGVTGEGVWYTTDSGVTWTHAAGVPSGVLGFALKVDPTDPNKVYAATGDGLWRSTDGGRSYGNVDLPTGPCHGNSFQPNCTLANMVTDVVIQPAPNTHGGTGGAVMAAVGWRNGQHQYTATGAVESPANGIYTSDTGAPGSFGNVHIDSALKHVPPDPAGEVLSQDKIGRIKLGIADGPDQNHQVVYAIIQDAVKFNGGISAIDVNENPTGLGALVYASVLQGMYVTTDFGGPRDASPGSHWAQVFNATELGNNPNTGSALSPPVCQVPAAVAYCPGVQAWYNLWVAPDPTRQTAAGLPTRVSFGLEEVWQNSDTNTAQTAHNPTNQHVIGRYYANETCGVLNAENGLPVCPGTPSVPSTTTHPDQHGSLYVPDGSGGVTFFVGNDGGVHKQHVGTGEEMGNDKWGDGANDGFHTLQLYDIKMAKDGVAYGGLQDNGQLKILPDGRQFSVWGGDGGFSAVDPDNSDVAYEEYVYGSMHVTTDGGVTWKAIDPGSPGAMFTQPFAMDPTNSQHLLAGGRTVEENTNGPDANWNTVFDLGTADNPGTPASDTDTSAQNIISAIDLRGATGYAGFCGFCDVLTEGQPFKNGIATNAGGTWHLAKAEGLPNRYINNVSIDPGDANTVYVALGGFARRWLVPGSLGESTDRVGSGHIYKSTDGGEHFSDVSGDLPDVPTYWTVLHGDQIIAATEIGVFSSTDRNGGKYAVLGKGMPTAEVTTLQLKPGDPDTLVASTFGRGAYTYKFASTRPTTATTSGAIACAAGEGFRSVSVKRKGKGLRIAVKRRLNRKFSFDVFEVSRGSRVHREKLVARFKNRKGSFTWKGKATVKRKRIGSGYYFTRATMKIPGKPTDVRRNALVRNRSGKFSKRPQFYRRATCDVIRAFKLSGPAFGGSTRRPLGVSYRLAAAAKVSVLIKRGKHKVRSYRARARRTGRTYRIKLPVKGLRKGNYRVTITVTSGKSKVKSALTSRKL